MNAETHGPAAALITGASSGIGRATAIELARHGWHVVLICRDPVRGQAVVDAISALATAPAATLLVADLSCLKATRELGQRLQCSALPVRLLINNAATWSKQRLVTHEGHERTLAVNYLAPFVLTQWLLPTLRDHGPARVVNVVSNVVRQFARLELDDLQTARRYGQIRAYRQSKLALLLFTRELARREREPQLTVNCLHPGDVLTHMTARGPLIDLIRPLLPRVEVEHAARACARVALAPELAGISGAYFEGDKLVELNRRTIAADTSQALWSETWRLVRDYLPATVRNASQAAP